VKERKKNMDSAFLAGETLLGGNYSQYTPSGKGLLAQQGRLGKIPHFGDKIYFYSPKLKRVSHVGIVTSVSKSGERYDIETAEGNTSSISFDRNGGCVSKKRYSFTLAEVGGTNRINCFCSPNFLESTCTAGGFVKVALEEVGYEEKASNANLEDKHANRGQANYTKYGAWYKENCGGDHPAYWCEQFVSWCAYMACKAHKEALKSGWVEIAGRWQYLEKGKPIKGQWLQVGGRWYVFDGSGNMIQGWFKSEEDWYYLNPTDGAMLSGQWIKLDGIDYYLTQSGVMARNVYILTDGVYYKVDENGKFIEEYKSTPADVESVGIAE
jgi:hypothetical protein